MSLKKYIILYERINFLIEHKTTGTSKQLGEKLGVSDRQVRNYIRDIEELKGKIYFSREYNSYCYFDD